MFTRLLPRGLKVWICANLTCLTFFLLRTCLASEKGCKKPIEMPGLSLAKLAIWTNSSGSSAVRGITSQVPLMSCVRAILECSDGGTKEGGSRDVHSSASPPPLPPFLKSGTVNQSQVSTRRIRSARVSLIGLMGFTPDCLLFSIKRPTAGGITAGVIHSYCWQSRRAPNTRQLFQITVKISVSQ